MLETLAPAAPHLSLDAITARLRRLHEWEIQSARLLGGWLPGVARWEVKHTMGQHLWQDAEHSKVWRTRLWELRVAKPERKPQPAVAAVVARLAAAQTDVEFLGGLYDGLKRALVEAYEQLLDRVHPVHDAPTLAALKRILPEKRAQLAWADEALPLLAKTEDQTRLVGRWVGHVREAIAAVGGVEGPEPDGWQLPEPPPGHARSPLPFPGAARDERFTVTLTGMALPPEGDHAAARLFQFFNYSQEMQAAETLATLLWEVDDMPWDFYYDIARHCYDEERHSALGEARLAELGHQVTDFPNNTANYAWRQLVDPLRRYAVLTYVIEADSFKYKHQTYQQHLAAGDMASAEAVLFDIVDETIHLRFGQQWVPELMKRADYTGTLEELVAECREILLAHTINPMQKASAHSARASKKATETATAPAS